MVLKTGSELIQVSTKSKCDVTYPNDAIAKSCDLHWLMFSKNLQWVFFLAQGHQEIITIFFLGQGRV